jgi:hypothetical protein
MPRYKLVDGNRIQLTAEEEAIKNAQEKATADREAIEEEERTAKENLKASAKAKLIAGQPLTEEEANTIVFELITTQPGKAKQYDKVYVDIVLMYFCIWNAKVQSRKYNPL